MDILTILIVALGLSMDSFSVSVGLGCSAQAFSWQKEIQMAAIFAIFQGVMPLIGWWGGLKLKFIIAGVDHWVALGLLTLIGVKMILDSFKPGECRTENNQIRVLTLCGLSLATSIDALAVGVSFGFLGAHLVPAVLIIGVITLIAVLIGLHFGGKLGPLLGKRVETIGGLVLIGIGIKIVIEHLLKNI